MAKPGNWVQMTPQEKRAWRLENFRNSGTNVQFVSSQAKLNFETRVQRLIDVYNLHKPDRIPLNLNAGNLPLTMAGLDAYSSFYETDKAIEAYMKFNEKYSEELEMFSMPMAGSGDALDILDYKLYCWPGHGLPKNAPGWQFIEGEYMTADEYDDLIRDPSDFWLRTYLPRVFGSFEGFRLFQPFTNINENVHVPYLSPLAEPQVQEMLQSLLKAGQAFKRNNGSMFRFMAGSPTHGFPSTFGAF